MSENRPPARRRVVLDPRLLIGIGLVVAAVAGTTAIVAAADRRVTVYAAADTFAPGDRIRAGDLLTREVALDDAGRLYLAAGDLPAGGLVVTAVVRRGELVPLSALGTVEGERSTSLVLPLSGAVSEAVTAGAAVDVWSASAVTSDGESTVSGGFGPPAVVTSDAVVVRVIEPDGIMSASAAESVEVLVPRSRIARLLQAIADGDALAVVPAGIPLGDR